MNTSDQTQQNKLHATNIKDICLMFQAKGPKKRRTAQMKMKKKKKKPYKE
jgi:hypothetical protein